jgi:nitrate reductase alpha subunit
MLIPGKTAPAMKVVERDYPATYERFTTLGPLMEKLGNGGKGIGWNTEHEVDFLKKLNGEKNGSAKIETDIDACEVVLSLAPETNGEVAVKAWAALSKITGRDHKHLACRRKKKKSASAIFRRSRARLSVHRHGAALNPSMSATTRAIPTCMNLFPGAR